MTVHTVNKPGGWCTVCGETEEWLRQRGGSDTIEYEEFDLAVPSDSGESGNPVK